MTARFRSAILCGIAAGGVLLALMTAAFPAASLAAGGEGEALLARVTAKYGAARSISAHFRQEVPLQNVGIVRKASGELYFAHPMKMRWDYKKPDNQLFLADGRYFYFRPTDSPQVFRRPLDEGTLGGKIPLLLFFGRGNVAELFTVEDIARLKGGAAVALRLVPKAGGAPEVKRVDLVVDTADLVIREIHLYDKLGGANHLYLNGVVFDPSLPADLFRFKKPEGTKVVDG
jgi:outer membrane lipoprotein carrier protein